ncbi:MAG: VCBS repeat-containing protein, partial [Actinobacteria bacterium]|nr:VCBS repeat-containing protein [Actinomycetota bacterium]NIV59197.1 hypothetical protein [Actinomycetota bacterium]NIV90814.1 hypothetical protein [Actinomycetota bacterium]
DALGWVERSISNTTLLASAVAVADLDGDGDPDVAAAAAADGTIEWHENTSGDATAWTDHPVGGSAGFVRSIRIADADADGDGDLFVASAADDTVAWFENTAGDGSTWTRRVINSLAEMAASVFVADLDGDGAPDVLSASSGDDRVTWYPNLGGQVRLTTEDTAPLAVAEGSGVVPLAIELRHNGRA